ncbi:MAG: acyl-CoA dehydrogenase family protein [Acidimicrobiales bacterium]|nr:acyl-CoA dehydrogenase family protein [Acidimicrobiales bacterium]
MTARATTLINDPSPEHSAFRATCREFAEREIAPLVDEAERSGVYPRQLRQRAAAAGLTGLSLPEACGGAGAGPTFLVIAIEELSRVCAGLATGLTGGLGEHLLCTVATGEQRDRFLGPTLAGEASGAFAMSEPDAGSDVLNMKGRAVRLPDGRWQITAQKMYITGAPFADYLFVAVYTAPERRGKGVSLFLVPTDTSGIEMHHLDKLGHRSMETAAVFIDSVLPADALLGEEGAGMRYIGETLEVGRVTHAARSLGVARAAYEYAEAHAHQRVVFGQTINGYQAIQFKLARMLITLRSAALHVMETARALEAGAHVMVEACMAKVVASEAAVGVATDAMQIMGGLGYMMETPVQRYLRDALLYPVSEGTTEIQLRTIARQTGIAEV